MWKYVAAFAVISLLTVKGLEQYTQFQGYDSQGDTQNLNQSEDKVALLESHKTDDEIVSYAGRKTTIEMDKRGHFVTTAKMNGRKVEVLVDTGATSVAINKSTARRLGIFLKASDFKYKVSTANGTTKAASAYIDRIEIGRVTVKNVRAAVLEDKALGETLLGMTFLGELEGFEVKNKKLILTQ